MYANDEFTYFVNQICEAFGVDAERVMSKDRTEEVVDARCVLCHVLSYQGMCNKLIAKLLSLTPQGVGYLLQRYEDLMSRSVWMRNVMDSLRNVVAATCRFDVRMKLKGTITIVSRK